MHQRSAWPLSPSNRALSEKQAIVHIYQLSSAMVRRTASQAAPEPSRPATPQGEEIEEVHSSLDCPQIYRLVDTLPGSVLRQCR